MIPSMQVSREGIPYIQSRPVFQGTSEEFLDKLTKSPAASPQLVITPNVDQIITAQYEPKLAEAYREATYLVIDGAPVLAFLRSLGAKRVHRITGSELIFTLSARAATGNLPVVITGGRPEVMHQAVAQLRVLCPGLSIEGVEFPMTENMSGQEAAAVAEQIQKLNPAFVFLCLGSPKQEEFFLSHRKLLPNAVFLGVGAAVDFAAGTRGRAPKWLQRLGLEWAFRLAQEPRRLAYRYAVKGPRFLGLMARSLLST